ncbi:MAG: flavodoxin family protein [Candidatus Thorarchaeota archaeon]
MTKGLVIYHSLFGNTKKIAMSLAGGLEEAGVPTDVLVIDDVDLQRLPEYDFIAIGGPTHILGVSKELKAFLERLSSLDLRGKKGFAFDTRNESRMNKRRYLVLENSAARRIEGKMKSMKMKVIRPRESAIVSGREGPLEQQAENSFFMIGKEIAKSINPDLMKISEST